MELEEARRRTRKLMVEHGLEEWTLKFTNSESLAGRCHYSKRLITLSRQITELNPWKGYVEDTALHEIAHALAPPRAHHNGTWKAIAIEIGATPQRCYDRSMKTPTPRWKAFCHCDDKVWRRHQRPARKQELWCPDCDKDLTDWEVWMRA